MIVLFTVGFFLAGGGGIRFILVTWAIKRGDVGDQARSAKYRKRNLIALVSGIVMMAPAIISGVFL